jgi:hypothetical protein
MHNAVPDSQRITVISTPRFVTIGGQRFLGGTLWYRRPPKRKLQDFIDMRQVDAPRGWFFDQQRLFQQQLYAGAFARELEAEPRIPSLEDTIVVTHHLPHPNSTPEIFKNSPADHFFMCNMTGAIMDRKPKLWLHGHSHDPSDYVVGATRIVAWPRGYPWEYKRRPPYEPKLIEV